jgi:hypothetical protein
MTTRVIDASRERCGEAVPDRDAVHSHIVALDVRSRKAGLRDPSAKPLEAERNELLIAVRRQELKGGDATVRGHRRFGSEAESEGAITEVEVQRWEERLRSVIDNGLGVLGRDAIPLERLEGCRLMASQKMGRDARFVIIPPRVPGLLEQNGGRRGIAVDGHSRGAESGNDSIAVDHASLRSSENRIDVDILI